jgi:hypothetical protein
LLQQSKPFFNVVPIRIIAYKVNYSMKPTVLKNWASSCSFVWTIGVVRNK